MFYGFFDRKLQKPICFQGYPEEKAVVFTPYGFWTLVAQKYGHRPLKPLLAVISSKPNKIKLASTKIWTCKDFKKVLELLLSIF